MILIIPIILNSLISKRKISKKTRSYKEGRIASTKKKRLEGSRKIIKINYTYEIPNI